MPRTLLAFLLALSVFATTASATTTISGTIVGDVTWTKEDGPYLVETLDIPLGSSLTIMPGTIVKLGQPTCNCYNNIGVAGRLTVGAPGASERAVITSIHDDIGGDTDGTDTPPAPGDWRMIDVNPTGLLELYQADVRYGGRAIAPYIYFNPWWTRQINNSGGTVVMDGVDLGYGYDTNYRQAFGGGTTSIRNSHIHDSGIGLQFYTGSATVEDTNFAVGTAIHFSINDSTLSHNGNSGFGGITPFGDLTTSTVTLAPDTIPYVFSGFTTEPGSSLTIMPGSVLKMTDNAFISVKGNLTIGAPASLPVTITSFKDDSRDGDTNADSTNTTPLPGDWYGVSFQSGSHGSVTNTELRHGGKPYGYFPSGQLENLGGTLDVASSSFSQSASTHIRQDAGVSTVTDSLLTNAPTGIFVGDGTFSVHHSRIAGNTTAGITNTGTTPVDATLNWWGSPTGPTHPSNPLGLGDPVSDTVHFVPYLTQDPTIMSSDPCEGVTDCNSNILFFPGIMGSRLFEVSDKCGLFNNEEERWVSMFDCEQARLMLDSNGKSINPIYTKEGEEGVIDDAYSFNLYQSFMHDLKSWKNHDHLIADYALVPYDWRLSLEDILQNGASTTGQLSFGVSQGFKNAYIYKTLESLVASSRTKKVTIIAHSNGGLLTKALIQKLKDINDPLYEKIDKIIFVAVPQTGTPEAVSNILHGDQVGPMGSVMSTKRLRSIAQNMPSAYHLLPMADYFDSTGAQVTTPVVTFEDGDTTQSFINTYGHSISSADNLKRFLLGVDGRSTPAYQDVANPIVLSPSLLSDAEDTRQKIGDSWTPSSGTEIYQIAGWGIPTLAGLKYRSIPHCERKDPIVIQGRLSYVCGQWGSTLTFDPDEVIDGDGTVVEPSALAMSTSSETVKRYWVDLDDYNSKHIVEATIFGRVHKDILEVPNLRLFIKSIVKGSLTVPEYISASTPQYEGTDSRLTFTLHSPLTLEFTDVQGNHAGPSTSTPETIDNLVPGARYVRYGEVQLLSIPKTATGTLTLNGISDGSFTLDVKEESGNDTLSQTSFEGIPSSTSTRVTMEITPVESPTASSTLVVDYDGDGATDFSLIAKVGDIVTLPPLDTTSPTTTASTTGTLGTNSWHTSNVVVTLTATDTESGVASTTYSLDNGVTWVTYTIPFTITKEGSTTILFFSTDTIGNREATNTLTLNIDKTAPESMISVSTTTQDLLVDGKDTQGNVAVTKDAIGNFTLTDQAGHTTKLFFTKTYAGKRLTYAKLTGIQYDGGTKKTLPSSSFVYLWDTKTPTTLLSQTIAVDGTYLIQAVFDKAKNKTTILVLKKSIPFKTQSFSGLRIPKLTTDKGVVGYSL